MRIHIATSARTDGAAYILKNDLINKFSNSSYKGTLNFTLTSMNTYGTRKTNSKGGSVNLQSTPGAVPSCSLDLANSTAYVTLASNNSKYILINYYIGYYMEYLAYQNYTRIKFRHSNQGQKSSPYHMHLNTI